jgi:hypothetical protein
MIIHSPIISGSLTFADGATFTLPTGGAFTGSIASTNGVISGSSQVQFNTVNGTPFSQSTDSVTTSKHIIPTTLTVDLGSATKPFRDLYLSSASLYIAGTQILSSNATELIFTTDTGQSIKFNELGTDNIVLQTADGDIELKSSGGGDILLDPTAGLISVKGNVSMQDGTSKFLSSGGTNIVFGNDLLVTGSITSNSTITGTTFNGTSFNGTINATNGVVSGSSQITYASVGSIPAGIVSGSSQLSGTTITDLTIVNLTTINETASVIFSSGSNRFGDFSNDTHSFTGSVQVSGSHTIIGAATATSLGIGMAASATAGRIDATNDIVAYSSSDIRFKENIVPIENALDKISKISGNTYDWKAETKAEHGYEGNDVGVIAQEIEAVLPQLVQTRENGYKAVKYDKLVTLLIEGIKEQQKQIDDLTSKVNSLENKI